MTRTLFLFSALLAPALAFGQSGGRPQYISDDITVTLRQQPRNESAPVGVLKSGAKVSLLESLGPESFARIRTADGREGWVTSRFLSSQPAAKERYQQAQASLDEAQKKAQNLERELTAAQQQLGLAKPAFELQRENETLKATITRLEQDKAGIQQRFDVERAKRRTLIAGGSLVGAGILLGLVLPWLGGGRKKRRYGDF